MRLNNKGTGLLGTMVILVIIAIGIIGTIMVVTSMQDYYSPITNDTVNLGMNETIHTVTNMTVIMVDVGSGIFWLFVIIFFIVLFGLVYAYARR